MSEASDLLQQLTEAIVEKDEAKVLKLLNLISPETELNDIKLIHGLLKFQNADVLNKTTELIAELAKKESNRKKFTDKELLNVLFSELEHQNCCVILNSVRALGNICYENEDACCIIDEKWTNKLIGILKEDNNRKDNDLTTKTAGLLLNIFNMNDELVKKCLKNGLLPILKSLLERYSRDFDKNETILTFLISLINTIEQYLVELDISNSQDLCKVLIDIFKQSKVPEISVPCLEIFHGQCEQEEIKTLFAKEGVCELLCDLIEKYRDKATDDDSRSVLKMACDFIVVILTGDECMLMLYNEGKGTVYKNMITWLDSEDPDLLSTGVLAIGNFARKDNHCIDMVKDGTSKKLLNILRRYNTSTNLEDIKIQHAILSTLKNLVIPHQNKETILKDGLIEVIYPMIAIDQYLVVFKLLGTFRMVIDGQRSTATDLISRKDFIERLAHWCYNSDHLGVRGEVPRLLARLIKQCQSFKPYKLLLDVPDAIKSIVEMISSNHAVMQNEAFYAIKLLYMGFSDEYAPANTNNVSDDNELTRFVRILIDSDIGHNLQFVLNKYAEKMDKHSIENVALLLDQLCKSVELIEHFRERDVGTPLNLLFENKNFCRMHILNTVEKLINNFEFED